MFEEIRRHQELQKANILRAFGVNPESDESLEFAKGEIEYDELQKAVYADTAENRKLGRVGQEYKRGKGKKSGEQPKSTSSMSGKDIKSLKNRRDELVSEYSELRKKNLNGTLKDEERSRFRALEKEIDDINLKLTRKNPTSKREIEKRIFAFKQKGFNNLTDEEKKEYGELNKRLSEKKVADIHPEKTDDTYPSRQEEKEIMRMMQEDGLDPDEQSEKTWKKYYKKVKQE